MVELAVEAINMVELSIGTFSTIDLSFEPRILSGPVSRMKLLKIKMMLVLKKAPKLIKKESNRNLSEKERREACHG